MSSNHPKVPGVRPQQKRKIGQHVSVSITLNHFRESNLYLTVEYWQLGLDQHEREKNAFSVGHGLFQQLHSVYVLLPPATFERLIERILKGLNRKSFLL